jgi:hypothetical protein
MSENIIKVGNGKVGKKLTDETKKRMSDAHKGENHHFFGKKLSDEHKRKISQALTKFGTIYKRGDRYTFEWKVDGKKYSKSFSIKRHGGEDGAKQKCMEYRQQIYPDSGVSEMK